MKFKVRVGVLPVNPDTYLNERMIWCNEFIGDRDVKWRSFHSELPSIGITYIFTNEQDLMLFVLRWGDDEI